MSAYFISRMLMTERLWWATRPRGRTPKPIAYQITSRGCYECISHQRKRGYPAMRFCGRQGSMSRALWTTIYGPIADGLVIRHRCDNRQCIRIDHLVIGTVMDNHRDCLERGRRACGERHYRVRLTEQGVRHIRNSPEKTAQELADALGVSRGAVESARYGRSWRHVS